MEKVGSPYFEVNARLVAKAIEELHFEELITLESQGESSFVFRQGDVCYEFIGRIGSWGNVFVEWASLSKKNDGTAVEICAKDFFLETKDLTGMTDETMGIFLEELDQTLYSDQILLKRQRGQELSKMAGLPLPRLESYLNGHPKLLLNKGRLGWGVNELSSYAPEAGVSFQLHWLAAKTSDLIMGVGEDISNEDILLESMTNKEVESFKSRLRSIEQGDWFIFPVHPWQWSRYIRIQYQKELALNKLVYLGAAGDQYLPQASIRTLSNIYRPWKCDIKLSLSILNTSCVRGIPPKYIGLGHKLSDFMKDIVGSDSYLKSNLKVLPETAAVSMPNSKYREGHEYYYRYHEMLGCVWRESSVLLNDKGLCVPTAALFFVHPDGGSLIGEYIRLSGLSSDEWIKTYFRKVVLPLYHLQIKYGVGLVSHGQNVLLRMEDFRPVGVSIKDFHGDLRFVEGIENMVSDIDSELVENVEKLKPGYLIHDLVTGHFITTLRYISRVMHDSLILGEDHFYELLGGVVSEYLMGQEIDGVRNLLRPEFEKVLVNKVRFEAGYSEGSQRLKPLLGSNMRNPLLNKNGTVIGDNINV